MLQYRIIPFHTDLIAKVEAVGARAKTGQEVGARAVLFPLVAILSQTISRAETKKYFKGELLCIYCAGQTSGFQESEMFFPRLRDRAKTFSPIAQPLAENCALRSQTKITGGICVLIVVLTKHHDSKNRYFFPRVRNRQIESAQKKNRRIEIDKKNAKLKSPKQKIAKSK